MTDTERKALVERLRSQGHLTQGDGLLALLDTGSQAADQIEADGQRIAELEAIVDDLLRRFDPWSPHDFTAVERARAALGESNADPQV